MTDITEATTHKVKILGTTAFISKEIQYATPCLASAHICIPGQIIKLRNERRRSVSKKPVKPFGDRPTALALFIDLGVGILPKSGSHSYVSTSKDHTDHAVASTAVEPANGIVAGAVKARTAELSFLNKRAHITSRSRTLGGESFKMFLGLQRLCWGEKLRFGNVLAIDAGVEFALFGRVAFRQVRSSSIDPGLDLVRGQACCVDDRAVGQVGAVDSVWVYGGEAGTAVKTCQLREVGERVGSCYACLKHVVVCLALQDDWNRSMRS
jgi:hypothetical protein